MNATVEAEGREVVMAVESSTLSVLNKSEIDQQIATAHKYPRSIRQFRDDVLALATLNESVAEECFYALPRDGKTIEGPSARFAEIVASSWGNCRAGARVVDERGEFVIAQGVFHDLQRNVAITYEVQRRIVNKKGVRFSADMVGVTSNAACSIALRNAILKGVPKALWVDCYETTKRTAIGDVTTLANRRAKAVTKFQQYGVSEAQILAKVNRASMDDVTPDDLLLLLGIVNAIKEGDTTPEQAFAESGGAEDLMPRAKDAAATALTGDAVDTSTGEVKESGKAATKKEAKPKAEAAKPDAARDESPATAGLLGQVKAALGHAALTDVDACKRFKLDKLDGVSVATAMDIISWSKNPAE